MIKEVLNMIMDEERALYNLTDAKVENCIFAGPADGESVLKECRNVEIKNCSFSLRYPLWHAESFIMTDSYLDEKTRAPIWYAKNGDINNCGFDGIKTLRECKNLSIKRCVAHSPEFGWCCENFKIEQSIIESEYFLFKCKNVNVDKLRMTGKYSFQYLENGIVENSFLNTKDAFWHSKNVTVKNSVIKGEYLAWYAEGLTLINCTIIGTQPLCYCKNLKLIDCKTVDCDLSFEYSDVNAVIKGNIVSVKNPKSGRIEADSITEIIREDAVTQCDADIIVGGEKI